MAPLPIDIPNGALLSRYECASAEDAIAAYDDYAGWPSDMEAPQRVRIVWVAEFLPGEDGITGVDTRDDQYVWFGWPVEPSEYWEVIW